MIKIIPNEQGSNCHSKFFICPFNTTIPTVSETFIINWQNSDLLKNVWQTEQELAEVSKAKMSKRFYVFISLYYANISLIFVLWKKKKLTGAWKMFLWPSSFFSISNTLMALAVLSCDGSWSKIFELGRVGHLWFGFGKFPLKNPKFFNFFPFESKKYLRVWSKITQVKYGSAPYLLLGRASHLWFGFRKFLLKTPNFKNFLLLVKENLFGLGQKVPRSNTGWPVIYCWVRSAILGLGMENFP